MTTNGQFTGIDFNLVRGPKTATQSGKLTLVE